VNPKLKTIPNLYETDFALWIEQTAQQLRSGTFEEVDWENVIEEIESLGLSDKRALRSQVTRVIMHLLKWDYQQQRRSNSWRGVLLKNAFRLENCSGTHRALNPT
jgi:hypothetical protein